MLEPLLDFLGDAWDVIKPWQIIDEDEAGLILRLGKLNRTLTSGFHWKWPCLEQPRVCNTAVDILNLNEQTIETDDGAQVTISCVVNYHVHNPSKALLKITDYDECIADACYGEIGMAVADNLNEDLNTEEFRDLLRDLCHKQTVKFGVTINSVGIENLCKARALRHFGV